MKAWKLVLVAGTLSGVVSVPTNMEIQQAVAPTLQPIPMKQLELEKSTPTYGLSRSPITSFATAKKPLSGLHIVVDPGHGGQAMLSKTHYTGGTVGVVTRQTESDVNLRVSLILRQYLEAAGAKVTMTRLSDDRCTLSTDKQSELDFRPDIANSCSADLFISVHHNESPNGSTNYTTTFYPKGTGQSVALAQNISSAVSRYLGTPCKGGEPGSYRVLSKIRMPGVIVEASFLSNPQEDLRLQCLAYDKMEAKGIATGILNYVRAQKNCQVDFNTIFAPIDDQAGTAQAIADASMMKTQILERRSLFGTHYEEVTCDGAGRVLSRRPVGGSSLDNQARASVAVAKSAIKTVASTPRKVVSKISSRKSSSSKKSVKVASASKSKSSSKSKSKRK